MARSDGGLIYGCGSWKRARRIKDAIEHHERFTDVVELGETSASRPELIFVTLEYSKIDYVAILEPGRRVATGQKTVAISHFTPLDVDIEELQEQVDKKFKNHLQFGSIGVARLAAKTWAALLKALTAEPKTAEAIKSTYARIQTLGRLRRQSRGELESFEHDAVAVALETWGGTKERKKRLRAAAVSLDENAPFLSRLSEVSLREDPQINHDAETMPGMAVARRYQTGIAVLENTRERLTIINCNRQRLEETLGVDLIYYNHSFRSFVLVQYKRMKRNDKGEASYRPDADASYAAEIERMNGISTELRAIKCKNRNTVDGFRLGQAAFYFKLCNDRAARATEEGMASGMYIPLRLWRALLRSKTTKGKRGGRLVTWENSPRKFNNSEFTSLLRQGWIGSTPTQSDRLNDIIEKSLAGKKMVVYAATSASTTRDDFYRDDHGRFALEDDPLASR